MPNLLVLLILACRFLVVRPASAQNNPSVTVDEDGNGTIVFTIPPGIFPTPGVLRADPGPGGLSSALTYDLLGPHSGFVAGDLIVSHFNFQGLPPTTSDVIRFNTLRLDATGHIAYPDALVFYSDIDADGPKLADTGLPTALYTNQLTVFEILRGGGLRAKRRPARVHSRVLGGISHRGQHRRSSPRTVHAVASRLRSAGPRRRYVETESGEVSRDAECGGLYAQES